MCQHGCTTQQLFELFHEFGHYDKCVELKGTVTLIQVSQFIFYFKKDTIHLTLDPPATQSRILCTFSDNSSLLDNLRAVCYEGMAFSHRCIPYSLPSIPSLIFNITNSPSWPFYHKGSDGYLYHEGLVSPAQAQQFNAKAREMAAFHQHHLKHSRSASIILDNTV